MKDMEPLDTVALTHLSRGSSLLRMAWREAEGRSSLVHLSAM
jgi:hypothetical protein